MSSGITAPPHDHAVMFYDDDAEWVERVGLFVEGGVSSGERAIVVATPSHQGLLERFLGERGLDVGELRTSGRVLTLDAEATLATLMSDGSPQRRQLSSRMGSLIDSATEDGSSVRIFGEMVAVLWWQGHVVGAIELEELWNGLARDHRFALLCAYPTEVIGQAPLDDLGRVCGLHSSLTAPRSYASSQPPALLDAEGPEVAVKTFVCDPAAVSLVRRFVRQTLQSWRQGELVADASLVASELATNALRHARSPFRVSVSRSHDVVRISVEDSVQYEPVLCSPTVEATWGRGVVIVDDVCRAWGSQPLPRGKVVWAELAVPH